MVFFSRGTAINFESRRGSDEGIMKSLNDDRVRVIAICGAGGVGKTTMVQRIEERVRNDKLFDEVVNVVVVSSLVGLEELKIFDCFHEWEAKGSQTEESNASQSELESFPTSLKIKISHCSLVPEEICLSQKFVRYGISQQLASCLGLPTYDKFMREISHSIYLETLKLDIGFTDW